VKLAADKRDASRLTFESDDVIARVEKHGDLFAPVLKLKQKLPHA
jgi:bifunctional non-homologous end joining protein LigD